MNAILILIGRGIRQYYAYIIAIVALILWGKGYFTPEEFLLGTHFFLRIFLITLLVCSTILKSFAAFRSENETSRHEFETAFLALILIRIVIQFSGPYAEYLMPLQYIILSMVAAYLNLAVALGLTLFFSLTSVARMISIWNFTDIYSVLFHFIISLLFIFFFGLVIRLEKKARENSQRFLDKLTKDGSHLEPSEGLEGLGRISAEARKRKNVDTLFLQDKLLGRLAEITRRALVAHSSVILTLEMDNATLSVIAYASEKDDIDLQVPVPVDGSIFSPAIHSGQPVSYKKLSTVRRPPYYIQRTQIKSLLAAPLFRGDHVIGVIVADSTDPEHFGSDEGQYLQLVGEQVVETMDQVRVIRNTSHQAEQFAAFYEVAQKVSSALKIEDVLRVVLSASSAIVKYDSAALSLSSYEDPEVSVITQVYNLPDELKGRSFGHNEGHVGWVTHLKTYLAHPDLSKVQRPIFSPEFRLRGVKSMLALPLINKDRAVGALTFFWNRVNAFSEGERKILEVLAIQAAVSLENAGIYEKMEEMAVTDGLTKLFNHRYFQDFLDAEMARTKRIPEKISLVLMDIDHFKKFNDTYGHQTGDLVLKRVAAVLQDSVRNIDLAARYGGEEFVLVLPDTDKKGGIKLAERVRKRIMNEKIDSSQGTLQVTVSLGVATYPDDAQHKQALIEYADTALYYSKETGRNRLSHYSDLPPEKRTPPPK